MTEQRDTAIKTTAERVEFHRVQADACLEAAALVRDLIDEQAEAVRDVLVAAAEQIDDRRANHLHIADSHAERVRVLLAHAEASVRGAPFRPVERLGVLTSVRPQNYEGLHR